MSICFFFFFLHSGYNASVKSQRKSFTRLMLHLVKLIMVREGWDCALPEKSEPEHMGFGPILAF